MSKLDGVDSIMHTVPVASRRPGAHAVLNNPEEITDIKHPYLKYLLSIFNSRN